MTTILLLLVVAALIGGFSYFTNAGFGDRRPPGDKAERKPQDSAPPEPPPHK
jgi:hypothetical protein